MRVNFTAYVGAAFHAHAFVWRSWLSEFPTSYTASSYPGR
jgi:hypothetical protein